MFSEKPNLIGDNENKKLGRPTVDEESAMLVQLSVPVTLDEKKTIKKKAKEKKIPTSHLVRSILREYGAFDKG